VRFLVRLAQYYIAPIGEVMRLALPPVDREAAEAVEERTLFSTAKGVSTRKVPWAIATDAVETEQKEKVALVLAQIRAHGALPVSRIGAKKALEKLVLGGLVRIEEREPLRDPFFVDALERDVPPEATGPQADAVITLDAAIDARTPSTFLLHGVTGSGKTEVYLRAIARAKEEKRGSIMLVPEIALTPQLVGRFRARFGDAVAVLHSGLTQRERFDMWNRLRRGDVDVAIGARSALFAPIE